MGINLNLPSASAPQPFLKWAGGKRTLLPDLQQAIKPFSGKYIEPFVGAGALFFAMPTEIPKIISDFNEELINVYFVIANHVEELELELNNYVNTKEHFLKIRAMDRDPDFSKLSPVVRAARFIYLNKTCFNGLYRVNSKGFFNVPYGSPKNPNYLNTSVLRRASEHLNGTNTSGKVQMMSGDFTKATSLAAQDDFVYFDPPYVPLTSTSSFVSYSENGFSLEDQRRLRDEAERLANLGAQVLISNSDTKLVRSIYSDKSLFSVKKVQVRRSIGASSNSRGSVPEVLISTKLKRA